MLRIVMIRCISIEYNSDKWNTGSVLIRITSYRHFHVKDWLASLPQLGSCRAVVYGTARTALHSCNAISHYNTSSISLAGSRKSFNMFLKCTTVYGNIKQHLSNNFTATMFCFCGKTKLQFQITCNHVLFS